MEIFDDSAWQMSRGERAALEGILTQSRPRLALEIGAAEGGSLAGIALHAEEVQAFDFVAPQFPDARPANVMVAEAEAVEVSVTGSGPTVSVWARGPASAPRYVTVELAKPERELDLRLDQPAQVNFIGYRG